MPKKSDSQATFRGWRYRCLACGFSTMSVGEAVAHINKNKGHQLKREEL